MKASTLSPRQIDVRFFLNNGNTKLENFSRDGPHLGENGKNINLDNYVNFLYQFLDFIVPY